MAIRPESLSGAEIVTVGGPAGPGGLSAYQVWLVLGNRGSPADFIASLKGEAGGGGSGGVITGTAAIATSGHRALYPRADGGGLAVASASDVTHAGRVVGISLAAASAGASISYVDDGPIDEPSWSFAPGPVWLGEQGQITQAVPASGFAQIVGTAVAPTRIVVSLQPPILLA